MRNKVIGPTAARYRRCAYLDACNFDVIIILATVKAFGVEDKLNT